MCAVCVYCMRVLYVLAWSPSSAQDAVIVLVCSPRLKKQTTTPVLCLPRPPPPAPPPASSNQSRSMLA